MEKKEETKGKQKEETKDSPIMKQWKELKAKHPDALLLFRVGDFYEMYEQDVKRGAEVLGITLTRKPDSICRTIWSLNRCLIIYLEINRKNNQIYEKIHE